jgi:hypothetical protein
MNNLLPIYGHLKINHYYWNYNKEYMYSVIEDCENIPDTRIDCINGYSLSVYSDRGIVYPGLDYNQPLLHNSPQIYNSKMYFIDIAENKIQIKRDLKIATYLSQDSDDNNQYTLWAYVYQTDPEEPDTVIEKVELRVSVNIYYENDYGGASYDNHEFFLTIQENEGYSDTVKLSFYYPRYHEVNINCTTVKDLKYYNFEHYIEWI